MLPSSFNIKKQAKTLLAGRWPLGIGAVLILMFFLFFVLAIYSLLYPYFSNGFPFVVLSVLTVLFVISVGFPLTLGVLRTFRAVYEKQETDLYSVFFYFSSKKLLLKVIRLCIYLVFRIAIISVLLLLPSFIIEGLSSGNMPFLDNNDLPLWLSNLWVFGTVLRGAAIAITVYIVLQYYMAPYIFILNDNIDVSETLFLAKKTAKLGISNFFALILSFLGWITLSLLAVPLIFTLPYAIMCYVVHCEAITDYYNKKIKSNKTSFIEDEFDL